MLCVDQKTFRKETEAHLYFLYLNNILGSRCKMSSLEAGCNIPPVLAPHQDVSEIQNYFSGKNVFVTGATGFLGKLIIEKLLRACDVKKIYVLVRQKKGKDSQERLKELFDIPAFEPLKKQSPDFADKILLCPGDCLEPDLGLSQEDVALLKKEVNCILHLAATVRFDASLRKATYINVRAVTDLIRMAKDMKQLTSLIHVSTAYSHCPRNDIDEKIYEPPITGQKLMNLVETLNDDVLDAITPTLLGQWPNTYVFTKAVAEEVVKSEGRGLPVSILKPSMVVSSWKEPIPGWIDNFYGATGVIAATAVGLLRTTHFVQNNTADIVPVDYVVNAILAAAWNVSQRLVCEARRPIIVKDPEDITVYNYVSGPQNRLTWDSFMILVRKHGTKIPPVLTIWYWIFLPTSNLYMYLLYDFFLHSVPAYVVDGILLCIRKKPVLVDGYRKIRKFSKVISYFATRQWNFNDSNVQNLWNKLSSRDKELFEFDIKRVEWDMYCVSYVFGCRVYLLKDPIDTLSQGKRKFRILKAAHYTLVAILSFLLYLSFKFLFQIVFNK